MRKVAVLLLVLVAVAIITPAALAQGTASAEKPPVNPTTLAIAAGFGVAIAAFGGGLGQGRIATWMVRGRWCSTASRRWCHTQPSAV